MSRITYADAGVDRVQEEAVISDLLKTIREHGKFNSSILNSGMFSSGVGFGNEILSMATDGVGSKVILAEELNILDTIGIDCVAMNVNDLMANGSIPISFVDYIAIRYPDKRIISEIVKGLVTGCNMADIPLIGGETAILPEIITGPRNRFDLAGTALGFVNKDAMITGSSIKEGDSIIGISSSGIHSNGLSLARKLFNPDEVTWRTELLKPTRIYVRTIKNLLKTEMKINAMANITGGGFTNLQRLGRYGYELEEWDIPKIFNEIKRRSRLDTGEMFRTFNMGIGYVIIASKSEEEVILELLNEDFPSQKIGEISSGDFVSVGGINL